MIHDGQGRSVDGKWKESTNTEKFQMECKTTNVICLEEYMHATRLEHETILLICHIRLALQQMISWKLKTRFSFWNIDV